MAGYIRQSSGHEESTTNMDYSIIYPNIYVYHNAIETPHKVIQAVEKKNLWADWFTFGKIIRHPQYPVYQKETFPKKEDWDIAIDNHDEEYIKIILKAFYRATSHYVNETGFELLNWEFELPCICRYDPFADVNAKYAMHYHTDFQPELKEFPGSKPGLTVTMYLNDEYDGGSLMFKIKNPKTNQIDSCEYTPKSGDILVFPSKDPYYHAVTPIYKDHKYFVRSFWDYKQEASEAWLAGIEEHGEDEWLRIKKDEARNQEKLFGNDIWMKENLGIKTES